MLSEVKKVQTANAIGKMMDMLNGGRTYEQKMKEMTKLFGIKENAINSYYNNYKLSKEVTVSRDSNIDTNTLSNIQTASDWSVEDKEDAVEQLSEIEKNT